MAFQMIHMEVAYRLLDILPKMEHPEAFILGSVAPDAVHTDPDFRIERKVASHLFEGCGPWGNTKDHQRWDDNIKSFLLSHQSDQEKRDFVWGICVHCLMDSCNDRFVWLHLKQKHVPPMEAEAFRESYYPEARGIDQWLYHHSPNKDRIFEMLKSAQAYEIPGVVRKDEMEKQREYLTQVQYASEPVSIEGYQYLSEAYLNSVLEESVKEIAKKLNEWQITFPYRVGKARVALELPEHYVWDCSVIEAEGKYHMFSSRWEKERGFGWNWVFHSRIIHSVADRPEGPYHFVREVLPPRGRSFFDGMNTHNTCIKEYQGKYYLYYMGCTYGGEVPDPAEDNYYPFALETWNRKRIGLAVADNINGPFVRRDTPLLEPRDCTYWDCTITTNPSVVILPDGKTYMIYKSRQGVGRPLKLGIAVADRPDGEFRRLTDEPILQFEDDNLHVEDPFIWYDADRKKFCLLAKDDCKNGSYGITGEWGSGFYAESDDCIHFTIASEPKVYSKTVTWEDGRTTTQGNMERPSLFIDKNGKPTHLFCASGHGDKAYTFEEGSFIVCLPLSDKEDPHK